LRRFPRAPECKKLGGDAVADEVRGEATTAAARQYHVGCDGKIKAISEIRQNSVKTSLPTRLHVAPAITRE